MIRYFTYLVVLAIIIVAANVSESVASTTLDEVIEAHGGLEALDSIRSIEIDQAGYFIGRYQSRDTLPPYDRLPVRLFAALDYETGQGAWDTISTWPGELNMGGRDILTTAQSWRLNTISRIYTKGSMRSFSSMSSGLANLLPALLVRNMARNPELVEAGPTRTFNYIEYDTLVYRERFTLFIHPQTRLVDVLETIEGGMWDHTLDEGTRLPVQRVYRQYFEQDGVMFPLRYQQWIDGVATRDVGLYRLRINQPVDEHLVLPEGFAEVPDMGGYSGQWDISVDKVSDGLYVAGNGETRLLYVEFADHFIVLEAGGFPSYARDVHEAMKPYMGGKPIRYIVPLHHHDDHAWAVHYYARMGATILTTPDKEGFLRKLLARTWGEHGPVEDARFEYISGRHLRMEDDFNAFDIFVWPAAPHSENMVLGYQAGSGSLFTGDFYIGWVSPGGEKVRQGAPHGVRQLAHWILARRKEGTMGDVNHYIAVHGRAYDAEEMNRMLATERTVTVLPGNEAWPTASWHERFGLADDTVGKARRATEIGGSF